MSNSTLKKDTLHKSTSLLGWLSPNPWLLLLEWAIYNTWGVLYTLPVLVLSSYKYTMPNIDNMLHYHTHRDCIWLDFTFSWYACYIRFLWLITNIYHVFFLIFLYKMAMTSHKLSFFSNKMSNKCTGCPIITEIDTFYHVTYPISDF